MDSEEAKEETPALDSPAAESLERLQKADEEIRRAAVALEERTRELDQALATMRATLEAATDAILVTDELGNITDYNEKFLTAWNISRSALGAGTAAEVRALACRQFEQSEHFTDHFDQAPGTDEDTAGLLTLKDGRTLEQHSRSLMMGGKATGRVWSFRDVTERRAAEIISRRLAAIVESSDDAIVSKDLNSIVTSWNAGAERLFGYTAEEMVGTSIMRLIPPERQDEEHEILARIRRGERFDHFETVRRAKDGRPLFVSITVSPIKDASGQVVGASKVARDISDRKAYEAALKGALRQAEEANRERLQLLDSEREARSQAERTSRMKDEFLATLSHELRTPLNAVLGWSNILRLGSLEGEDLKHGMEAIERNARAQAQIIEDLLDMSRIISGKVRLEVELVDLPRVLNESLETVRAAAQAKGVHLEIVASEHLEPVSGDPNRLQQVFWNLLNNAIKFTPKEGTVRVQLEHLHSHMEVSISDTGEGIAPEFLPYVFDRFQQADASTTRRHGGLGLGLAIVKQLVELHGGSARVKSPGKGQGSTFIVSLPFFAAHAVPSPIQKTSLLSSRETTTLPQISLAEVTILVVDDEPDVRSLVKRLLEMAGAKVALAASSAEAMAYLATSPADILICDIGMPGEDGYTLIRRIRASTGPIRDMPAIAVTAYARSEDRTKAIRLGFQNHLAKPVDPGELLAVVGSLIGRREAAA